MELQNQILLNYTHADAFGADLAELNKQPIPARLLIKISQVKDAIIKQMQHLSDVRKETMLKHGAREEGLNVILPTPPKEFIDEMEDLGKEAFSIPIEEKIKIPAQFQSGKETIDVCLSPGAYDNLLKNFIDIV